MKQNHVVSPRSAMVRGAITGFAGCDAPGCKALNCLRRDARLEIGQHRCTGFFPRVEPEQLGQVAH